MPFYCLKCRKNTENKHSKVVRTKNGRILLSSKVQCMIVIKSKFLKEQVATGLLSNLGGTKVPILRKISISNTF